MRRRTNGRGRSIVLIGFSGSGKSTLGKMLARTLKIPFVDLDAEIVTREGMSVVDMFSQEGERYFRRAETNSLTELASRADERRVLALGGGAFQSEQNRQLSRRLGVVVYLRCSVRELYRRMSKTTDRPLLNAIFRPENIAREAKLLRIKRLVAIREPQYRTAEIVVSTSAGTLQEIVARLSHKVNAYYAEYDS